jgi:hypothetical protein
MAAAQFWIGVMGSTASSLEVTFRNRCPSG